MAHTNRHPHASDPRDGPGAEQAPFDSLVLHFRPRAVLERTLRITLTWGLGGMAVVLVALAIVSGLLLKFVYQPSPEGAYNSILSLQNELRFGQLIRNVHYWSANALMPAVLLHLLRVFFTGAHYPPRQRNWLVGLGLFLLALGANFTGYLLPWDQLAYWAVTVSTGMLAYLPVVGGGLQSTLIGGEEIGAHTLLAFYAFHTAVIPAAMLVLMALHFWHIRQVGGLVIPRSPTEGPNPPCAEVPTRPNLFLRETAVAALVVACILLLSAGLHAPLGPHANPGLSPNPTKAPWYFAGFQELLVHFHPLVAVVLIPTLVAAGAVLLPYLKHPSDTRGVWFRSRTGRRTAALSVVAALVATPLLVIVDDVAIDGVGWLAAVPAVIRDGLIPLALLLAAVAGYLGWLRKTCSVTQEEAVQAVVVLLLTAFLVLTVTCVGFRGQGMALSWPL